MRWMRSTTETVQEVESWLVTYVRSRTYGRWRRYHVNESDVRVLSRVRVLNSTFLWKGVGVGKSESCGSVWNPASYFPVRFSLNIKMWYKLNRQNRPALGLVPFLPPSLPEILEFWFYLVNSSWTHFSGLHDTFYESSVKYLKRGFFDGAGLTWLSKVYKFRR